MHFILVIALMGFCRGEDDEDLLLSESDKPIYRYIPVTPQPPTYRSETVNQHQSNPQTNIRYGINTQLLEAIPQDQHEQTLQTALASNPLLAALFLSSSLGIQPTARGFNHPQHLPINPYVALLLSHYGRYINVPLNRLQRGLYGYTAANNLHNNKPFGAYKIYQDTR